ncbi:glycosyltransferase family 2 protein [Kaistia terrae]|uniref:Glycosyltransferase family 2 protein n=1 Tax=Kaistia terrae TaxID=537017 RepID=A0ABW0PUH8_9HYPH|nr:glycosyltransferase family 2 protein [Kaistia terrae]MCX5576720.1 glycosyltransferase family 2 protein [Kaistia terrae]
MDFTIVITTFNRAHLVSRAIRSALVWYTPEMTIVVVDDASEDETQSVILQLFEKEIRNGVIEYVRLPVNLGASGAKNAGVEKSKGEWVVILDSDDELIPNAFEVVSRTIIKHAGDDGVFFRSIDGQTGEKVGPPQSPIYLGPKEIFSPGLPGETLLVAKRATHLRFPFPVELRGCESLAFRSMAVGGLRLRLTDTPARIYHQPSFGRLSVGAGFRSRYKYIAVYHWRSAGFWRHAGLKHAAISSAKSVVYALLYASWRLDSFWQSRRSSDPKGT